MKSYFKTLSLVIVFSLLLLSCAESERTQSSEASLAPDFKLQSLDNIMFTLASYRNKQPLILFFWTTWCPFCRRELTTLNERYQDLTKDKCGLFAISVGEPAYKAENFAKNYKLTFPVLLDKDARVAQYYEVLGVPTYFFVDKEGRIIFKDNYFSEEKYKELISR